MSVRQYSLTQKFYSRTIQLDHKLIRPISSKQTRRLFLSDQSHRSPQLKEQRCVPAVQITDSARNPLRGQVTRVIHRAAFSLVGTADGVMYMGEGCTRNRPPPAERVFLHVDEWRHTMEWHGGQTSHRRRREGFWPLWEAEVQRPADVSRRVYVRRRRR